MFQCKAPIPQLRGQFDPVLLGQLISVDPIALEKASWDVEFHHQQPPEIPRNLRDAPHFLLPGAGRDEELRQRFRAH